MCDWEEQKRLVTIDLSLDFGLLKSVNVCKKELLVKTGRNANSLSETQRYRALRMTTISKRWPLVRHCKPVFPSSLKWHEHLSQLKVGSILKRSAGKKLSINGRGNLPNAERRILVSGVSCETCVFEVMKLLRSLHDSSSSQMNNF